jgi:hypothetical protein
MPAGDLSDDALRLDAPAAAARIGRVAASPTRKRAATHYQDHRDYVLAVLRRRCGWLARDERE